ncbi:MAG: type II toxin-antitoxin system VapC family toxin [Bacteroidetes bacterium]|nr:type II toxin-antitoxin system VapC family toxin [Bacteroidota bacterium]MBI3482387.1 type II toxin-antitoxin system VapC family toxin [Bacteroidota bacterium]
MGQGHLIDTNCIIDFSLGKIPEKGKIFLASIIDGHPTISVINKIEALGFSIVNNGIVELVNSSTVIGLTDEIINQTIVIRREHKIKLPDAIIAATALVFELTLVTRNFSDFKMLSGLELVDPWSL